MQEWQSLNRRQVHHSKVWDPEFIHAINDRQKVSPYDPQESADLELKIDDSLVAKMHPFNAFAKEKLNEGAAMKNENHRNDFQNSQVRGHCPPHSPWQS